MASSNAAQKRKKVGMAMQLPPHVQTNLNKEARLLQQNLEDLEKKTRQRLSCIIRDQQVAGIKLQSLQIRLVASQSKSYNAQMQPQPLSGQSIPGPASYKGMTVTIQKSRPDLSLKQSGHSEQPDLKATRRSPPKSAKTVSFS